MSNINGETRAQPELCEEDILNNAQVIRMMDFGNEVRLVMENFKDCEKIEIKHFNIINEHIEEVKKLHKIFREFVKESLDLNEQIEDYSYKIKYLADCFNDNNCSDEDILKLLKSHLKDSQKNCMLAKKLKNRLINDEENIGIIGELRQIQNSTYGHIVDFKDEIDLDEKLIISYEGGAFYSICVFVLLNLAAALDYINITSKKFNLAKKMEIKLEDEKVVIKKNQLSNKRNELDIIKQFDENMSSIILGIGRIETFWDMQIRSIEFLIKKLKKLKTSGRERITQRQIVYSIEQKWKNVGKECQLYYIAMKKLLHENKVR
jgi:hypothetical protein